MVMGAAVDQKLLKIRRAPGTNNVRRRWNLAAVSSLAWHLLADLIRVAATDRLRFHAATADSTHERGSGGLRDSC